jgi:hypothetical protein
VIVGAHNKEANASIAQPVNIVIVIIMVVGN